MSAPPDPSSDVSKATASDKRTREFPDTITKPGGKSLKASGEPTSSQNAASGQGAQADDMSVDFTTEKDDSTKQRTTTRRLANNTPEARLQIKALHSRVPAWKISMCSQSSIECKAHRSCTHCRSD